MEINLDLNMKYLLEILLVLLINWIKSDNSVVAHVGLTYPPARKFDLDFMDNIRTKPPCGMPKGKFGTTLVAGRPTNITWHLSYPHRGGYRLELLDAKENFIMDLVTGKNSTDFMIGDPTAQWYTVIIPKDVKCEDCSIRLLRQASEWANSYRFWSCADVQIVSPDQYKENCFNNGKVINNNQCKCDKGFWGPSCQFEDECSSDVDCGKGTCVDLGGTSLPNKQCFCPPNLHGVKCTKSNKVELPTAKTLDLSKHTRKLLSNRMNLFYKVISDEDEMEFVLVVNGSSYGAIGWRPASFNKSCKLWPYVDDSTLARSARDISKRRIYKPNPTLLRPLTPLEKSMAEPEPEISMGQQSFHNSKIRSKEPITQPHPEVEPEPESEPETKSEPESASSEPEPEGSAKSEPESESEPEAHAESEPERHDAISEPEDESYHSYTRETRKSSYSPKGDFHAMDCTDIVIGAARGVYSRILDYYTRDRSTPRLDTFWGGSDSITSATGWEQNGVTVIIFRRKVVSSQPTDHSLQGEMHVIWARGQQKGEYVHSPKSGLEKDSPSVPNFYANDEIKYHGHGGQRGVTFIEFPS